MKSRYLSTLLALTTACALLAGCASSQTETKTKETKQTETSAKEQETSTEKETVAPIDVVTDDMVAIPGSEVQDGVYPVQVDSSSSMFKIASCELTVADGVMTAALTINSASYNRLFLGTAEEAANAKEEDLINYEETSDGARVFTFPVEALDAGVNCAALSAKKDLWYDRTLVFRADSLPADAFAEGVISTPQKPELEDGTYTIAVDLEGGSGKASVASPTTLKAEDGKVIAVITWSSPNYDYMMVDGEKYLPVNTDGNSVFEIPVSGFDYKIPVSADTTAMSTPHEIEYTLYFHSDSVTLSEN